jgi:hypothetical protein
MSACGNQGISEYPQYLTRLPFLVMTAGGAEVVDQGVLISNVLLGLPNAAFSFGDGIFSVRHFSSPPPYRRRLFAGTALGRALGFGGG